jgi:hypothetical protein
MFPLHTQHQLENEFLSALLAEAEHIFDQAEKLRANRLG